MESAFNLDLALWFNQEYTGPDKTVCLVKMWSDDQLGIKGGGDKAGVHDLGEGWIHHVPYLVTRLSQQDGGGG